MWIFENVVGYLIIQDLSIFVYLKTYLSVGTPGDFESEVSAT